MAKKSAKKPSETQKKQTPLHAAEKQIEGGMKKSSAWVKKNPGKATAIAAAATLALGALAATLFRRKKK